MSDTVIKNQPQTYRFQFVCDECIHSISFKGNLSLEADRELLKEVRRHLLQESPETIRSYLEQHHIPYFDFHADVIEADHSNVMHLAELLLHSNSLDRTDELFERSDLYYAVIDHQKQLANSCCEGCYLALKKTTPSDNTTFHCNIIGQIFKENSTASDGYFAIRESRNTHFHDIARATGKPVLPPFGCIDTLGLLLSIDRIKTADQTERIALL